MLGNNGVAGTRQRSRLFETAVSVGGDWLELRRELFVWKDLEANLGPRDGSLVRMVDEAADDLRRAPVAR